MSPVIVFVTRLLPNGWTVKASPYVTSPTASPPAISVDEQIAANAARVHERDDGAAEVGRRPSRRAAPSAMTSPSVALAERREHGRGSGRPGSCR